MQQEEMLTTKEATQAFLDAGLSETTFRKRIKDGIINRHMPEGRQRGALYPKTQVLDAIAAATKGKTVKTPKKIKSTSPLKPASFMQATPEDMPEMARLLETFYNRIDVKKRAAWIERNPEIAFILRSKGELVGCAFVMPLSEEKIMQILESQVKPPTKPHEIPLYEAGKHYTLYVRAVGVAQNVSKAQRKHWAARLIYGLCEAIIELGKKGVYIDRLYAQGDTKAGEKALRALGFAQIDVKAPTTRKNYMLDIATSGTPFAKRYKYVLDTWRAQFEEE